MKHFLELSKVLFYDTYYDILQTYFGQANVKLHYVDTNFFLSVNIVDITNEWKNFNDLFHFNKLNKKHLLFSDEK